MPTAATIKLDNANRIWLLTYAFYTGGQYGFWYYLEDVTFDIDSGTLTTIPERMFYGLNYLNYPSQSIMNNLTEIGTGAFQNVGYQTQQTGIYDLVLPNIVILYGNAFNSNNMLKTITLGTYGNSNLSSIGAACFRNSGYVETINILETPSSIGSNAFGGMNSTAVMNVVWSSGAVSGAPWGFTGTINYDYVPAQ